ncbi:hypothetical protein MNBD_BACTEROID01-1053, partial [hydrothermal vent metagenome]
MQKQVISLLAIMGVLTVLAGYALGGGKIIAHDPVMARENGTYYLFCTGWGISAWSSPDMVNWTKEEPVFSKTPEWA